MHVSYMRTMYYLVYTQYLIFLQTIKDKLIDLAIWIIAMGAITIYLLPSFGIALTYGAFTIVSMSASAGLFEQNSSTISLVGDFEGDNITSFYLTLPIRSWMVFLSYGIFYTFNCIILTSVVLPLGKIFFWNHLHFTHFSFLAYITMLFAVSAFYASFTLCMVALVPNLNHAGSVWMRFIFPLWTFGAFQYSYQVLYDVSPFLARLSWANPMTFVMEGTRAAVLGQADYLNVWVCVGMILMYTVLFAAFGILRIKRRLDYV